MPYFRLLGAQLAVGAAAIFARYALSGAGPISVSALRLTLAALVLAATVRFTRGLRARLSSGREAAFALAGIALALHFAAWIASLLYTSVAISTVLVAATPVWTELYDSVAFRRRPSTSFIAALALAFAGISLIARQRAADAPIPGHALFGDGLALAGGLAIAAYFLIVRDAGRLADGSPLPTQRIVFRTYGWAALLLIIAAGASHQGPPAPSNFAAWGGIAGMAFISQLLGHTALNRSLRDFSPSVIGLSTLLEPVAAAVLAAVIFGERISLAAGIGGALILAGIAISMLGTRPASIDLHAG